MKYKYTQEQLKQAVDKSFSILEVMRKLGIPSSGGNHSHLTKKIKKNKLDTSHFSGRKSNLGKPSFNKKHWEDVLVYRKERKENIIILRRALLESGREYLCYCCGQVPIWNNEKLILEIHHKDGNWLNNVKENLEFVCPNCHSQKHSTNTKIEQN